MQSVLPIEGIPCPRISDTVTHRGYFPNAKRPYLAENWMMCEHGGVETIICDFTIFQTQRHENPRYCARLQNTAITKCCGLIL